MQNIEIKAKYPDLEQARNLAQEIGARFEASYHQIDTYFNVQEGRLKLREFDSEGSQLIYYRRPNQSAAKLSDYSIYPVARSADLKSLLTEALGVWLVVEKRRDLYWFDEVRIHLDRVTDLGNFLELEGVLSRSAVESEVKQKVEWLIKTLRISPVDLIDVSYSDLLSSIPGVN